MFKKGLNINRNFKLCTFRKVVNQLFILNKKLYSNTEAKKSELIMTEDSDKPIRTLNFNSLLKNKRKIVTQIITQPTNKKPRAIVDLKSMIEELKQLKNPPTTLWEKQISSGRLPYSFFNVPSTTLAKNMLGKILVRKLEDGTILKGKIVETESYLGVEDKASHTYGGKVTPRNIPMFMPPGTTYVYFTYGMYYCFNISSQEEGSAVLVRALEPLQGIEQMMENRSYKPNFKKISKELKIHELCNGPSKICMAMKLDKSHSKYSLCDWKELWLEDDQSKDEIKIVECSRIGIESAGEEWAKKPLRYYIYNNKCVSKRDKKAEKTLLEN